MKVEFEVSPRRIAMTALCGFVGLMALAAAFPDGYVLWPKSSADWAAWVQAVGSIATIIGAVAISQRELQKQKEREERQERQARRQQLQTFVVLIKHAAGITEKIALETPNHSIYFQWAATRLVEVGGINARVSMLHPRDFAESSELMDALSVTTSSAQVLAAELDGYVRGYQSGQQNPASLQSIAEDVAKNFRRCASSVEKILEGQLS